MDKIFKKAIRCKWCKQIFYDYIIPKICPLCNKDPITKKQYINNPIKRVLGNGKGEIWRMNIKCEICKTKRATLIKNSKYRCAGC